MESVGATNSKRSRVESDESLEAPDSKRTRDDLLDIFDDYSFESIVKFLEEVVLPAPSSCSGELSSETSDSAPDLSFLLEASDDDLGLPPTNTESSKAEDGDVAEAAEGGQIREIRDEIASFDFGDINGEDGELVFGGPGDYADGEFGSDFDFSDIVWRPESLPAP